MVRKETKAKKIENYLLTGKSLTPLQALNWFNSMSLASIIHRLKLRGWKIKTEIITGTRYAKYSMLNF